MFIITCLIVLLRVLIVAGEALHDSLRSSLRIIDSTPTVVLGRVPHSKALSVIPDVYPDVVLLDAGADSGAVLRSWAQQQLHDVALVCVAPDVHFALDAFHAGATHYLMTPVSDAELEVAVARCGQLLHSTEGSRQNKIAQAKQRSSLTKPYNCQVIALPSASAIEVRRQDALISAHGNGSYTKVVLTDEPPIVLTRSLGDLAAELEDYGLVRVHRSHMVNLLQVRTVQRGRVPALKLSNGVVVDVSDTYRESVFQALRIGRFRGG